MSIYIQSLPSWKTLNLSPLRLSCQLTIPENQTKQLELRFLCKEKEINHDLVQPLRAILPYQNRSRVCHLQLMWQDSRWICKGKQEGDRSGDEKHQWRKKRSNDIDRSIGWKGITILGHYSYFSFFLFLICFIQDVIIVVFSNCRQDPSAYFKQKFWEMLLPQNCGFCFLFTDPVILNMKLLNNDIVQIADSSGN